MGKQRSKVTPESSPETPKQSTSTNSIWKIATYTLIISFATIGALIIGTIALLWNKVYPAIQIANTDISLLTTDQAEQRIASQINQRLNASYEDIGKTLQNYYDI
jgi:membrane peptidoglycan carboxypeptidase